MTAVKAKFDGQQIEVPPELRAASPREVVIVFDEPPAPATVTSAASASIWDAIAKAPPGKLTAAEVDARIRAEREEWGDR